MGSWGAGTVTTKWYGYNLGMLQPIGAPDSTLKKRHVSIAYHMCREQVATGALLPIKMQTGENVADTATKALENESFTHLNSVLLSKLFQTDGQVSLRRVGVWYLPNRRGA
jgi:hypothetical protein